MIMGVRFFAKCLFVPPRIRKNVLFTLSLGGLFYLELFALWQLCAYIFWINDFVLVLVYYIMFYYVMKNNNIRSNVVYRFMLLLFVLFVDNGDLDTREAHTD